MPLTDAATRAPSLGALKLAQAQSLLEPHDLGAWLIVVRESADRPDPILRFFHDGDFTWTTFFIVTPERSVALVATFDAPDVTRAGIFDDVRTYKEGPKAALLEILAALAPSRIGINVSRDDALADGLTAGLRDYLVETLAGTPFAERLVSAEKFLAHLRGVKLPEERERIRLAIDRTEAMFDHVRESIAIGLTQREVASRYHRMAAEEGVRTAWPRAFCPTVTIGPHSAIGHTAPGEERITDGCIVHMDFGIALDGYCSDLQRLWYVSGSGRRGIPAEVARAYETIVAAIDVAAKALRPGAVGWEVDRAARELIVSRGYPEYAHALGHHLGRAVHDGGGVLGPRWERYGREPFAAVREGNVYTLEPSIHLPEHGLVSLEEDVVVASAGTVFLSRFPRELPVVRPA
ncbi:MAG TPA: Xaa-Pro peptidase family protein [Candidatus Eisenbacteria bacterium]